VQQEEQDLIVAAADGADEWCVEAHNALQLVVDFALSYRVEGDIAAVAVADHIVRSLRIQSLLIQ
jgi:hypothetical protein